MKEEKDGFWAFPDGWMTTSTFQTENCIPLLWGWSSYLFSCTNVLHLTDTCLALVLYFTDTGKLNEALVIKIILDSKMVTVSRKFQSRERKHFNEEAALNTNTTGFGSTSLKKAGWGLKNTLKDTGESVGKFPGRM